MSKAALKKTLLAMEKEQVVEMVMEMYAARKEAREYLEFWLDPDPKKELEKRKKQLYSVFVSAEKPIRSPRIPEANKIVKDFMAITFDPDQKMQLLIYLLKLYMAWMEIRGRRLTFRPGVEKRMAEAEALLDDCERKGPWKEMLADIRRRAYDLWESEPVYSGRRRRRGWWEKG